jgi:hypothetical protein
MRPNNPKFGHKVSKAWPINCSTDPTFTYAIWARNLEFSILVNMGGANINAFRFGHVGWIENEVAHLLFIYCLAQSNLVRKNSNYFTLRKIKLFIRQKKQKEIKSFYSWHDKSNMWVSEGPNSINNVDLIIYIQGRSNGSTIHARILNLLKRKKFTKKKRLIISHKFISLW